MKTIKRKASILLTAVIEFACSKVGNSFADSDFDSYAAYEQLERSSNRLAYTTCAIAAVALIFFATFAVSVW